jgi:broad specificity phosphatase PhoE
MPFLVFIRHAAPDIDPEVPSKRWRLSRAGRASSRSLANRLKDFEIATIVTSVESKAKETGEIIADELGILCLVRQGLQENDRQGVEIVDEDAYRALIAKVFAQPDRTVMGRETAHMASDRFHRAILDALGEAPGETIAVVAHGVVMSLFVSRFNSIDTFGFWSGLGLPSAVVLDRNSFRLDRIIDV